MEIASIVLEYVRVLAWPCVAAVVLFCYRKPIGRLIGRIADESTELPTPIGPIKIPERHEEIREDIKEIRQANQNGNPEEVKRRLDKLQYDTAWQQFVEVAPKFFTEPRASRHYLEKVVVDLAGFLDLPTILEFARSPERGERVGAGIALREFLKRNPSEEKSKEVIKALQQGIEDPFSKVRYRFIEAIDTSESLRKRFTNDLQKIANGDESPGVSRIAMQVLSSMSK